MAMASTRPRAWRACRPASPSATTIAGRGSTASARASPTPRNGRRASSIACSALKRAYRDRIRAAAPGVRFVFLDGPAELIESRMAGRTGHYMPSTLLASQLQTLEPPGVDERDALRVGVELPASEVVRRAVLALRTG